MSSIKRILVSLTAALIGGLGVTVGGSPAAAVPLPTTEDPTSWTVSTAPSQYGSGRSMFGYTMNAGDDLTDSINIANTGTGPIMLKVYAADGFTTDAGEFDILTGDEKSTDLGTWVKPAVSRVTVAVGQEVQVPFSIAVPTNATAGDHMGGIVTELDQKSNGANGGTVVHQRAWLSIKVRVSGEVAPQLKIQSVKVNFDGTSNPLGTGAATINYTMRNAGNTALSGLQKATVSGPFGLSSKTIHGKRLPELFPGERWNTQVRVDKIHAVLWVSGKVTFTPVLKDAAGSTSTLEPITDSDRSFVSIWSFALMMLPLLGPAAVLWLLIRLGNACAVRPRRRSTRKPCAELPLPAPEFRIRAGR